MEEVLRKVDVIPAQAGFNYAVPCWQDGTIIAIDRTPLIAWRITTQIYADETSEPWSGDCVPIGLTGEGIFYDTHAIETPDGRLTVPCGRKFDNEVDLLNYWYKEEAERKAWSTPTHSA